MKCYYEIKPYLNYEKTQFYTIQEVGKELNETDEFFLRFKNDPVYQKDIEIIKAWIQKIGIEYGALERFFRPELSASAIPITGAKLRLYCHRINEQIVILGNGGIKSSQAVQGSPDAFPHFEIMNKIAYLTKLNFNTEK